ncbi:hypothetical protein B0H21DRAFT_826803 [Amylocystis lapponica]|nr:hypothetical protein B0H21DRAFT_826803 [Amylocystis lapponica]
MASSWGTGPASCSLTAGALIVLAILFVAVGPSALLSESAHPQLEGSVARLTATLRVFVFPYSLANLFQNFGPGHLPAHRCRRQGRTRSLTHKGEPKSRPQRHRLRTPHPKTDIDDVSAPVVYAQGSPERERDPFDAHATPYYTTGTVPPTPPASACAHARSGSREEDMIWSLCTQSALQSELRLEGAQGAAEERGDEVDRSGEESAESSVMDEASGEARRMFHRRIKMLERERVDAEWRERQAREEQLKKAREVERRDESERVLKASIKATKEEMEEMSGMGQAQVQDGEIRAQESEDTARAQACWEEERALLVQENEALRNEKVARHPISSARRSPCTTVLTASPSRAENSAPSLRSSRGRGYSSISGRNVCLDHMYARVLHGALATLLIP